MLNYSHGVIYLVISNLFNLNTVIDKLTYKYLLISGMLGSVDLDMFFRL